jgi:hypothetical protein
MRKTTVGALLGLLSSIALLATPALAHHGWSSYDKSKPLKLSGTITEISYVYPHASIKLDVAGKKWLAVLAPPSRLSSRGLGSGDIKIGAQATVEGYPSREDATQMRAERITLDGKVYELH